jgi:hypothetical protein
MRVLIVVLLSLYSFACNELLVYLVVQSFLCFNRLQTLSFALHFKSVATEIQNFFQ